jgi:hypothetical protein
MEAKCLSCGAPWDTDLGYMCTECGCYGCPICQEPFLDDPIIPDCKHFICAVNNEFPLSEGISHEGIQNHFSRFEDLSDENGYLPEGLQDYIDSLESTDTSEIYTLPKEFSADDTIDTNSLTLFELAFKHYDVIKVSIDVGMSGYSLSYYFSKDRDAIWAKVSDSMERLLTTLEDMARNLPNE